MRNKTFTDKLFSEMKDWVNDGLIDQSQEQRIRSRYIKSESEKPAAPHEEKTINAVKIVIVLASILLAAGIIL